MRRVVITGLGIVSCIGNNQSEVLDSLLNTKSGIVFSEDHKKYNFRSQVVGSIKNLNLSDHIDRKKMRFMGDGSAYNYIAMSESIKDSGLEEKDISNEMTGIIMGSGGPSIKNVVLAVDATRESGPKKMGPCIVPRTMSSTNSATLAVPFKIRGINYSISSACATSGHCIGNGMELIQYGKQNVVFAGGGEELNWGMSGMFDAMTALSSKYNDTPEKASRPYDKDRDGFIIAGGAGTLVLEEYEHAKARGAKIYAELTGYGATSDGYDMVAPSGEGAARCMNMALKTARNKVDYINSHGTSTPVGDVKELEAIKSVFKDNVPKISSTKSLTGHSLGATSVQEAIYCLLMMKNKFISASAHIENIDEKAKNFPIVTKVEKEKDLNCTMSNSFGFGGTNATLVFEKVN
ncbi:beta-ketoacyl-ACP synthase I [bacterium]|nr:beta-ketoacyl-ACP synthase I [bacterium]